MIFKRITVPFYKGTAEKEVYVLSGGRKIDANKGLISISEEGWLYEGYDSTLAEAISPEEHEYEPLALHWTPEERAEVADHMIARWTKFKEGR